MQISEIISDIDLLCGTTSASYSTANKIRNINIAYNDVARLIWESEGAWQYDDSNATTLPCATTNLVHNQQDYEIPSTAQRIHRIEVLDSNGQWSKLTQLDPVDIATSMSEFQGDPNIPLYYDLKGRSMLLYPSPSSAFVTTTNGLKIYMDRDVTEFPATATTSTPGFAKSFHRILSLAASIDFMQDDRQKEFLAQQKKRLEDGLTRFYGKRNVERREAIRPSKNWRQYV